MFSILSIPISIEETGTEFISSPIYIPVGIKVLGWEFTTPDYTNSVTTTVSILSAAGRTMYTGSEINEDTASIDIFADGECPIVFSGFKVKALVSGVTGSSHTFIVNLYAEDTSSNLVSLPANLATLVNFEHKLASLNQIAPVQNTWYTLLDTVHNVKLFGVGILIADTGETLGVKLTVDGETITGSGAATADTDYKVLINTTATGNTITLSSSALVNANQLECRSLKIEVRKTTAAGTGNLKASVAYGQRG